MDEVPLVGIEDTRNAFKTFQALAVPAFIRRGREVEAAWETVLHRCRKQRQEWLPMVTLRLGTLKALAGDWTVLLPLLAEEDGREHLERMHEALAPKLRSPIVPTTSVRRLRSALLELKESMELFNRRWRAFLPTVDLQSVNELREGYNRWYVLEKECAVRSPRIARLGFVPLEPATTEHLFALLPLLPVPIPA